MVVYLLAQDPVDLDRSVLLAVTVLADVVLATTELEDDELVAEPVLDDLSRHLRAADDGLADLDVRSVSRGEEEDAVELDRRALVAGQLLDDDGLTGLNPVLLSTSFDDGVHGLLRFERFGI